MESDYVIVGAGSAGCAVAYRLAEAGLADLRFGDDQSLYEREVAAWIRNHSTEVYPKTRQTAEDFILSHTDHQIRGKLRPFSLWLDSQELLSAGFRETIGQIEAETVDNYGSYLRSYLMQGYLFESGAAGADPEDIMDWTHGTDTTAPLVSEAVMHMGWRLPSDHMVKDGVNKVLARRAMRGVVADEILDEVTKGGFNAPTDNWFRNELHDDVMDTFASRSFRERGIYDLDRFDELTRQHMTGEANHMMLLWQALNFELWARKWRPSV